MYLLTLLGEKIISSHKVMKNVVKGSASLFSYHSGNGGLIMLQIVQNNYYFLYINVDHEIQT